MALNFANNNSLSAITALPASISGGALDQTSTDQEIQDTVTGLKDGLLGLIKQNQKALNELGL